MDECSDQIKILRANDSSTQICVVVNNCMKSLCISDWRWTCSFFINQIWYIAQEVKALCKLVLFKFFQFSLDLYRMNFYLEQR